MIFSRSPYGLLQRKGSELPKENQVHDNTASDHLSSIIKMEITIRHQEAKDLPSIGAFFNDHSLTANTSQIPYNDAEHWEKLFATQSNEKIQLVAESEGNIVGHLGIMLSSKPRKKHVALFAIAIHPDFQGKGVGSLLMEELINLCDNWLNIIRIELAVFTDNEHAIALYKKYGFEIEGTSRFDAFKNGRYASTHNMARIRPDFAQVAS